MKVKIALLIVLAIILVLFITHKTEHNPQKAQEFFNNGKRYYSEGKMDEAIKMYEKGLKNDPDSSDGYNLLGIAYRSKHQVIKNNSYKRKEIQAFEKAIKADPNNWYPYINLGATYYFMDRKKDAVKYLKKGLEINPRNLEAARIKKMIEEGEKEK